LTLSWKTYNKTLEFLLVFDNKELTMSSYLRGLDECGWLKHIKSVLDTSLFIAKVNKQNKPIS